MKLKNKETGKIRDFEFVAITKDMDAEFAKYAHNAPVLICRSIDQLNEEWEDYEPTEPLITDERVRKAVRAWANANDIGKESCYGKDVEFDMVEHRLKWVETSIEFNSIKGLEELRDGRGYTIDELCGEEEE